MATFNNVDTFEELRDAIATSKNNGQADTINITGNITLSADLPTITEDVGLTVNGGNFTLSGNNERRILFVKSGTIDLNNLNFSNGRAQGGAGIGAGAGNAGMGGALFIYGGNVTIRNATFANNRAIGGSAGAAFGSIGLGFLANPANFGSDGADGTITAPNGGNGGSGSYGGYGGYGGDGFNGTRDRAAGNGGNGGNGGFAGIGRGGGDGGNGGTGRTLDNADIGGGRGGNGGNGGFGAVGGKGGIGGNGGEGFFSEADPNDTPTIGGDGGTGGNGGFGGAGGNGGKGGNVGTENGFPARLKGNGGNGGNGGYGAGAGRGGIPTPSVGLFVNPDLEGTIGAGGLGGFGGGNANPNAVNGAASNSGGGAGMGGAIFIRSGSLTLNTIAFNSNTTTGGTGYQNGKGYGSAIFAMKSTTNTNGNNQGMPTTLSTVSLSRVSFSGNNAGDATGNVTPGTIGSGTDFNNDDLFGKTFSEINSAPTGVSFNNALTSLPENTSTANRVKVADIVVNDDALGTNTLSLSGADAAAFEIISSALYIRTGTTLDFETKPSYSVTVNVNDPTVGGNPDASAPFNLAIGNINEAVNLSVSPSTGTEAGTTAITVTATASQAVVGNQTMNLALSGTGITAGDFTGVIPSQITILNGQTTGSFTVNINDDAAIEGTETATFAISSPSAGIMLGATTSGNVAITDNDFPAVNLSVSPSTGTEAGTTAITVTATASQAVLGNQTMNVALSGTGITAGDFTGVIPSRITILNGQTTGSFTVNINDDAAIEGTETSTFAISNPSSGIVLGSTTTGNVAISDNDFPAVNLSVSPSTGTEAGTTAITVTATASQAVLGNQTMNLVLSGTGITAGDFTGIIPSQITILNDQTTGSFTVNINDDAAIEGLETATFAISNPSSGIVLGATTSGNVAIADNDFPAVNLSVSPSTGTEAGTTAITVTATASQAVLGNQTMNLVLSGTGITAGDFTGIIPSQITILNGQTTGSFTVNINDDAAIEGLETATFAISNPSSGIVLGATTSGNVAIADNDFPAVNLSISPSTGTEAGTTAITVTATSSQAVVENQTVNVALSGTGITAGDFTGTIPSQITILNGQTTGSFTVNINDDTLIEPTETATFTIAQPSSGIVLGATTSGSVTITDNDISLAIAPTDANRLEGNIDNTPFAFTVTRTGDTSSAVTTNWTVTGGVTNPANAADFGGTFPTGTVNFGVGETTKAITVNVSGDTLGELDENFTVTLSNPSIPATITTATAAGSILNDDKALIVTPTNASQAEGNSGLRAFTFTINRTGDSNLTTDLKWSVTGSGANPANAADFDSGILPIGKVRFLPGETSKLISVNVRGDTTVESDETFSVTIVAVAGGSTPVTIGTGTIVNDDGVAPSPVAAIRSNAISGTAGNDTLLGTAGNDTLNGVDPLNGAGTGEVDRLSGGEGSSDRFILGDANKTYYLGNGISNYALITDFGAGDLIQTRTGNALFIGGVLPSGIFGTALYLDTDLVAVVQGVVPTSASFVSV